MREAWVGPLVREDPLEEVMATHSSIPAWRIPWTEEPGGLHTVHGAAKSWTGLRLSLTPSHITKCIIWIIFKGRVWWR